MPKNKRTLFFDDSFFKTSKRITIDYEFKNTSEFFTLAARKVALELYTGTTSLEELRKEFGNGEVLNSLIAVPQENKKNAVLQPKVESEGFNKNETLNQKTECKNSKDLENDRGTTGINNVQFDDLNETINSFGANSIIEIDLKRNKLKYNHVEGEEL